MNTTDTLDPQGLFGFWKNLALIVIFIILTPIALATSLFSLYSINKDSKIKTEIVQKTANLIEAPISGVRVYASLPTQPKEVSAAIEKADARELIVRNYLANYDSPILPHAGKIVEAADKYGIDFRLISAIAQQESNLCKKIPEDSYNCWGWGIHSKGSLGFQSFDEGIETVTKGLKENYIAIGLVTPSQIMSKYVPHSPDGAWAKGVTAFMEEMQ